LSASAAPEPAQRLFFALWPQEKQRQALVRATAKATRSCGGRPVLAANLHVTLAFLGSVPRRRVPELADIARRAAQAFAQDAPPVLRFSALAHWPRQQILCVLGAEEQPLLHSLAGALKDAAAAAGFSPDLKPFHAHVTVARKVAHAPPRRVLRALLWRCASFALIDSRTESAGPVYSVIESYPLVKAEKAHE
jgi:RNA 2',3'-cyclic 3'-phosphodiesterase